MGASGRTEWPAWWDWELEFSSHSECPRCEIEGHPRPRGIADDRQLDYVQPLPSFDARPPTA